MHSPLSPTLLAAGLSQVWKTAFVFSMQVQKGNSRNVENHCNLFDTKTA